MEGCVFCKIVKGEIPCHKIYDDEEFLAFLTIEPYCEGHTLIIPKKHFRWVWDLPAGRQASSLEKYFTVVSKIANRYKEIFKTDFVMSYIYGYEILHAHIHLLPNARGKIAVYPKEGKKQLTAEEGKKLVEKLKLS